jgi:3D (Asp-Asp-Asp) domain-containing protein
MKNLVRGGFVLAIAGLFVAYIYAAQTQPVLVLSSAIDSQTQLNNTIDNKEEVKEESLEPQVQDKKDKVTKTVSSRSTAVNRFTATAYCLKGRTALGHGVRRGIIAADPRVLRLGSRINLGAGAYSGSYLVSDTGGAVKGRKIDIWMPSCSEARRFGRRTVTVGAL